MIDFRRRLIDDAATNTELRSLLEARRRALLTGDADALARVLHQDFCYVDSLGRRLDRSTYLASRRSGEITFSRHDLSEIVIDELEAARAAMITCLVDDAGAFKGEPFEARCRAVHVCVNQGAGWVFLFGQSTTTEATAGR